MTPRPLLSRPAGPLSGTVRVPGDKSVSHRALMIGALATGETEIHGLLTGADVLHTAAAMRALGAAVETGGDGVWRVRGVGVGGIAEPDLVLEMGNSGTAARLLMGLVASHPVTCFFTGDASLAKRPMARITTPLERMGASFVTRAGGRMPLAVIGTDSPLPITYRLPVASAQVKSAVLLAGLNTPGVTTVIESEPTRDHTELMLRHFGAKIETERLEDGALAVSLTGEAELAGRSVRVPGDPSSAAFPAVAALLIEGSDLLIEGVGINPRRTGLYETLREMGGDVTFENERREAGEPVADLRLRATGGLRGVVVPPERAPSMIDEYPILAVAAACAEGTTVMQGLAELRVKESDRLAMVAAGLDACGVAVEAGADTLTVHGGGRPPGGATVATSMDHRIAMSFLVLGMAAREPVGVDDASFIETSFPGFADLMNGLGADIAGESPGAAPGPLPPGAA